MKSRQLQEIKNKSKPELEKELILMRDKLWNLKKDLAAGKVKNVREIRSLRKSIAQVLTTATKYE